MVAHGFRGFSHDHLALLLWTCGGVEHHGGSRWERKTVHLIMARKLSKRKGLESQYLLQGTPPMT
jgi:hypothetical protein